VSELGAQPQEGRLFSSFFEYANLIFTHVVTSWLALFATFGSSASFGVYQDFYVRSGTATSSNAAWIGSVQLFFLTFMGLPAGKLLDKGHFRLVILTGSILYVFRFVYKTTSMRTLRLINLLFPSYFMLSLVHLDRYYQIFLAQGVGAGIGSGLIYMPSVAIQAHYWREHRALVMGLAITGTVSSGCHSPVPQLGL
jgi:MFS family permease